MSPRQARRLGAALLAALGLAAPSPAKDAPETMPDVPSGAAVLRGRVIHGDRPEDVGGVEVVLYSLSAGGSPGSRHGQSDPDGSFRFENVSNDPTVVYLVGARHAELPFPGERVVFAPGETERAIEIRIWEPSEDPSHVRLVQSSLRVEWAGDRIALGEVHRLRNDGERVYHVAPGRRGAGRAALHARLPEGAGEFSMPLGLVPEGAVLQGSDFRFWGPLYPGEQEISFRYEVPVQAGRQALEKRFPTAAERIRVFAREDGPLLSVDGLAPAAAIEDEGAPFRSFEVARAPAGLRATLRLAIPESVADPAAVSLVESQLVLEVDDVSLQAQEQHRIEVTGPAVVRAAPGELLLRLSLPEGAEDVRFAPDASSLGLVASEDGVGVVGPLPPGSHGIGLAYTLGTGPDGVHLERSFDRRLPLLRVFVADTGVAVESDRLHRRRPVREADRTYLIFEAFELAADEPFSLALRALPPRAGSGHPALAVALVAGLAAVVFLLSPLRHAATPASRAAEPEAPATRGERDALYESIHDLDHDFETGKLGEADWQTLRAELRTRAVELLARERTEREAAGVRDRGRPGERPEAAARAAEPPSCSRCAARAREGDRFCSRCGSPLPPRTSDA